MSEEARRPGFYWVKLVKWEIALFCRSDGGAEWWVVPGEHRPYQTSDFAEVGERPTLEELAETRRARGESAWDPPRPRE